MTDSLSHYFNRRHLLRSGRPTTVVVIQEEAQWEDNSGETYWSNDVDAAKAAGCWLVGIRLILLSGQELELDDDEYRYYSYVGPILRLYPSESDFTGVEVF